jgi:hypothetical protein
LDAFELNSITQLQMGKQFLGFRFKDFGKNGHGGMKSNVTVDCSWQRFVHGTMWDMTEKKTLLLVDGSSYLYRAFHAMPDLRAVPGDPTSVLPVRYVAWST